MDTVLYPVISSLVSLIPLDLPFPFFSNSSTYPEKFSAYECGFDPSGDARSRFDIRFYLVLILFIIPDPEAYSFQGKGQSYRFVQDFPYELELQFFDDSIFLSWAKQRILSLK
ncbi:NADH-ubiquinone oxidoreductase chain 3 [Phtheirospermum japonicum]|uniref:NADH-ubiquinone oxidoreductase chain 3 n=1 Tax=Phtheirospermum japonicum TaxID=374723 RepID=A0A830C1U3_9LAMI|nr:NADH-ubiquinone oxidoreductase chain 3 [Phtheirospermum japonicum]